MRYEIGEEKNEKILIIKTSGIMKQKKLKNIKRCSNDGLVFIDTAVPSEWGEGIPKMLIDARIIRDISCFEEPFYVKTTSGRLDTVIPFAKNARIRMPKLVGWKELNKSLNINSYWIYDYIDKLSTEHDKE